MGEHKLRLRIRTAPDPIVALRNLVDGLRPLFDANLLGGTLRPAYRAARRALVDAEKSVEALRQMTVYASALRRVACDEGHMSILGLAWQRAGIGDPLDAIDDAQAILSEHGVEVNLNGR